MTVNEAFAGRLRELFATARNELCMPAPDAEAMRRISDGEIATLRGRGCVCSDWSKIYLREGSDLSRMGNCRLEGIVRLDLSRPEGGPEPLIIDSSLRNVCTGPGCRIVSAGSVRNLILLEGAVIENCGRVAFDEGSLCGCGVELELGVETGERNVPSFPYLDIETAADLSGGEGRDGRLALYGEMLDAFLDMLRTGQMGFIGQGCRLTDTAVIENCFLGPGALISNATAVRNSTLLGGEPGGASVIDGALVRDSILQWSAEVDSMAIVERSMVGEATRVERHGKLTSSFLGPNSVLGEGEITSSLAGPFTSAHHQSLLIAARWPGGRGNVGYGANVGSNHTSRLPDQEVRPGEGMFFGLACSVKFPADFSRSPYSMIATGVTTLPQRVEFPFSLICEPFIEAPGVPPAYRQIIPAWVLSDNMFALRRNERKFLKRNRAKRWKPSHEGVMNEETAGLMVDALKRLEVKETREVYTEEHVPGIGRNFLTEEHRLRAIETYRFHLKLYALEKLSDGKGRVPAGSVAEEVLRVEFHGMDDRTLPEARKAMLERLEEDVRRSRMKDHRRGAAVIDDYLEVHSIED